MLIAVHEKGRSGVRFLHGARLTGKLPSLGQIRHATIKTNDYYPLIAHAVERLDRSTGEARRAVYESARKAVAELRSHQLALLDAEITEERLALEEAIRKVEAVAARKSPTETLTEPQAAPTEGMRDGDNQSRDYGQPASPDRDDRPPGLPSRQAPISLSTASDDRNNADIQAVAIGGAYGADHYHDDVLGSHWPGSPFVLLALLALAVLAVTFAYRTMFGGSVFPALLPIIKASTGPNNIVRNNSDTQTSVTSAGPSDKLQPMDIRDAPKALPRVISTIPLSSNPSAAAVVPLAPASVTPAPTLAPPLLTEASVPPPASAPVPVPASSELKETAAVAPVAREPSAPAPTLAPPLLTDASVPPPASAPVPVPASSESKETAAVAPVAREPSAPAPTLAPPLLTEASVPPPASAPLPVPASSESKETAAVAPVAREPSAPAPTLAPPLLTDASVPPPASAPVPVPASSELKETAAVAPVAREPIAPAPTLAPPLLTEASVPPPASAPVPVPASSELKETAAVAPVAREPSAPAPTLAPPLLTSRSPMQVRSGTALEVSFGGAYAVQVISQRSAAEARASFRALRAKFPNQLGGREPIVRRTDLGAKGIYYRAMVGPFSSMEKAAGMCRTLKAAGCNCLVQRN